MQRVPASKKPPVLEPVAFHGITVGQSTKQKLLDEWGDPADTVATAEGIVFAFDIDPFQSVEVLVGEGDVVAAIKIALASPLDPKQLADQLSLSDIRTVTAFDEADEPLGMAFPERGVIFMYDASDAGNAKPDAESAAVSHVVLQRLDPLAFAMRAEHALHGHYSQNIKDLKTAIQLDPRCAHAHSLLARIYLATGQADMAEEAAGTACEIDPDNASYQLLRGRAMELQGQFDDSVLTVRAVLDRENLAPIDKAQGLHQMGCLASLGDVEIASKAISFHTRAIEAADPLATSTNGKERRAAKQILVEAHLAIAEEVARQAFQNKVETLSLWIGRASGIAEEYIGHDDGSVELRLMIAQRALAALTSFRPTLDPAPWVDEAEEAAQTMFAHSGDDLWQARVKWELGLAYLHALRVEHVRRETESALRYGNKAVDYLAKGAKMRQAVYSSEQFIGLLYFQMGAVQAVHQLDHAKAAKWYDKAEPLLTSPAPRSELFAPRREGEMLVSMGVTYWQVGDKDRAMALTQNGVARVEAAVEAGILSRSALAVPYGNLATMYEKLGESSNAAKYSELARSAAGGDPPRVSQAPNVNQASNTSGGKPQRPRKTSQR
jgi:tetratricopeptide (TPR) repeat protein